MRRARTAPGQVLNFYATHQPCIDALRATGATYMVWCPGAMKARGKKSSPPPAPRLHHDAASAAAWDFVSYEDAAHAILEAVESGSTFDNKLFSAVSPPAQPDL